MKKGTAYTYIERMRNGAPYPRLQAAKEKEKGMTYEVNCRVWFDQLKAMVRVRSIEFDEMVGVWLFNGRMPEQCDRVMWGTELKDKDGREIYEGDILRNCDTENWPRDIRTIERQINLFNVPRVSWTYEVIGNIHENPELLDSEVLAGGPSHHIPGVSACPSK